ncbi:MAG: hypothetical protein GY941_21050 [Planctomycetes bacterium]|nr:hypothetical protein [Planctomycetota bacterium]
MATQTIEFKNAESNMFVRLEKGEIYGNPDIFVAFAKTAESSEWKKQGNYPMSKWDEKVAEFESYGLVANSAII